MVNGNLIVKAPHCAIWRKNASVFCVCASVDVHEEENRASHIFTVHVDTYDIRVFIMVAKIKIHVIISRHI